LVGTASDLTPTRSLTGDDALRQRYVLPRKRHSKIPPLQRGDSAPAD